MKIAQKHLEVGRHSQGTAMAGPVQSPKAPLTRTESQSMNK